MNCIICGRPISQPRSLERGMGPSCWRRSKSDGITAALFGGAQLFDGPTHPEYEAANQAEKLVMDHNADAADLKGRDILSAQEKFIKKTSASLRVAIKEITANAWRDYVKIFRGMS
jgi:Family of unknown function (DUF6011)